MTSSALVPVPQAGEVLKNVTTIYRSLRLDSQKEYDVFRTLVEVAEHPVFQQFVDRLGESEEGIRSAICLIRIYKIITDMFPGLVPTQKIYLLRIALDMDEPQYEHKQLTL